MKLIHPLILVLLVGCASNPLMTGKPQDWVGHSADDMLAALGEPTRRIPQSNGEIWEYRQAGQMLAGETSQTRFGAASNPFQGLQGNVTTTKTPAGVAEYENVWRYLVRNGRVKSWFSARYENGREIWSDH